jgi:hypothetical protein
VSSEPRHHHLLAKLYQRGFANGRDQVKIVRKTTGQTFTCNISEAFKQRDWNAFRDEDGVLCQDIERLLADQVDTPASRGLAALRDGRWPISDEEREGVGRFIAAQPTRGRHFRDTTSGFMARLARHTVALVAKHYSDERIEAITGEVPTPKAREMLAKGAVDLQPTQAPLLEAMLDPINMLTVGMINRDWVLIEFDEPCLFTSDEPVWSDGPWLIAPEIRLPLSPQRVLVLGRPDLGLQERTVRCTLDQARLVNLGTLLHEASTSLLLAPDVASYPLPPADYGWGVSPKVLAELGALRSAG